MKLKRFPTLKSFRLSLMMLLIPTSLNHIRSLMTTLRRIISLTIRKSRFAITINLFITVTTSRLITFIRTRMRESIMARITLRLMIINSIPFHRPMNRTFWVRKSTAIIIISLWMNELQTLIHHYWIYFSFRSFTGGFSPKESIYDEATSSTIASELPLRNNEFQQKLVDGKESFISSLDTFSIKLLYALLWIRILFPSFVYFLSFSHANSTSSSWT